MCSHVCGIFSIHTYELVFIENISNSLALYGMWGGGLLLIKRLSSKKEIFIKDL